MTMTMYERLLSLPLLQGLSEEKLTALLERCKFEFSNYQDGEVVLEQGEPVNALYFVLSGTICSSLENRAKTLLITECLDEMKIIPLSNLYGRNRCSPSLITAVGETVILKLSREEIVTMIQAEEIVLINLMNIVFTRSQGTVNTLLAIDHVNGEQQLAFWILSLTHRQSFDITVACRRKTLSKLLGVSVNALTKVLDEWERKGVITVIDDKVFTIRSRADMEEIIYN